MRKAVKNIKPLKAKGSLFGKAFAKITGSRRMKPIGRRYWFDVADNSDEVIGLARSAASARGIRFEDTYRQGYGYHYVYATKAESEAILAEVPSLNYIKLGRKQGRELRWWLKVFGMRR